VGRTSGNDKETLSKHQSFRQRMMDQCYRIGQYRHAVMRDEGRTLSPDEAGMEWVERHAEAFARDHDEG